MNLIVIIIDCSQTMFLETSKLTNLLFEVIGLTLSIIGMLLLHEECRLRYAVYPNCLMYNMSPSNPKL